MVLKWLTQLFEFAAVGSVASLSGNGNAGVDAEEIERARRAIVVSFASARRSAVVGVVRGRGTSYPPAAMARFWHGYKPS